MASSGDLTAKIGPLPAYAWGGVAGVGLLALYAYRSHGASRGAKPVAQDALGNTSANLDGLLASSGGYINHSPGDFPNGVLTTRTNPDGTVITTQYPYGTLPANGYPPAPQTTVPGPVGVRGPAGPAGPVGRSGTVVIPHPRPVVPRPRPIVHAHPPVHHTVHRLPAAQHGNAWIANIQTELNHHGARLRVDGIEGPQTHAAIMSFQRTRHLVPDGIVGPKTRGAMGF